MNQVYAKLPYSLQFAAINFYGLNVRRKRYTPKFKNILEQYKKIDKQAVHYLNFSRIKDITEGSPFYSIDSPESFYKLPLLTKDLAARFYEKIVNKDHMITSLSTSGTTSAPFRMPVSRDFIYNQWAVFWKFRMIHGLNLDSWCAYFIGKPVVAKERITPPYWIKSYPTKQLLFSIFHINRNTVESYLDEIKKNKIRWLHAYPSVLNLLAELIEEKGLFKKAKELGLSLITTSSEVLLELQKNNIESIFGCRIRQLYGLTEGVANIFECEHGRLHVDENFSFVEFIKDEQSIPFYKIVGSHYFNKAFPLIRYDTGDLAIPDESGQACPCGRQSRIVKEIIGRDQDFIYLHDTTKVVAPDLIFKNICNVQKVQIIQNRIGHASFYIVRGSQYDGKDERLIKTRISSHLGSNFQFDIVYANKLQLNKNGKIPFVIHNVE